jgi:dTDP-4-amino-4,6-dideoxygalactose transaminase
MKIPFCLPVIDQDVINEMMDTLTNTGWLTTGPKARALEEEIRKFVNAEAVLCVNSWTSGAMLMLRWFGVGSGDEVIIPAYTYSATALCVMNMGATPIMVDVKEDFTIDPEQIKKAITSKTKAIIPVDMGGYPCDYESINAIVNALEYKSLFIPNSENQKKLGRILVLSDAAHSLGAKYNDLQSGLLSDVTVFSLHSVKNITTGEGGAIVLNLKDIFDNNVELRFLRALSLNGQNKSAFEKNQPGAWRYDIIDQGLKVNMPDLCASIGLAQMRRYSSKFLPERKAIFEYYTNELSQYKWAILPTFKDEKIESSCHLFLLRIKGFNEEKRDAMIQYIGEQGVGVNVHYIPMTMLSLFKSRGYDIKKYPVTYQLYENEITLPVYNNLKKEQLDYVIKTIIRAYDFVVNNFKK